MQQLKQRAAQKKKRAELLRQKAVNKFEAACDAVDRLKPDAWVKLPLMEGTQTLASSLVSFQQRTSTSSQIAQVSKSPNVLQASCHG